MSPSVRSHLRPGNLLARLDKEELSLLVLSGSRVLYSSKADGIRPLIEAIDSLGIKMLQGSVIVDKVVGKASALLICYFGAKRTFAKIMSVTGAGVLRAHRVDYFAKKLVREIRNKNNTDICPFEKVVMQVDKPSEAYTLIRSKLNENTSQPET